MKSMKTIPLHAEIREREKLSFFGRAFSLLKELNETTHAFTGWCKSKLTGKPGAAALPEGLSTFGSTGLLCPLYPSMIREVAVMHVYYHKSASVSKAHTADRSVSPFISKPFNN
jgi:hypothetical protein